MKMIRELFLVSTLFLFSFSVSSQHIKIAVISDTHYLSDMLVGEGEALTRYEQNTGRRINVLHEVLDKALCEIIEEVPDVLLITGDITNHGEKQSHIDFISKLKVVKNSGVRIFVIPGNHDVNVPNAKSYIGDNSLDVPGVTEHEFKNMYQDYGYGDILQMDDCSLSYLTEIDKSIWLIAFDSNLHKQYKSSSMSKGRISSETMNWALNILNEAKSRDIMVIGMMHHGLVEHLPYQSDFFSDYLIEDWKENAEKLADAGMKVMFTGHFHSNDVSMYTSELGNVIYDVETGSLSQYPFPYRVINIDDGELNVNTFSIDRIKSVSNLQQVYRGYYEEILKRNVSSKLYSLGIPMMDDVREVLVNLLVQLALQHTVGDEKMDEKTIRILNLLGGVLNIGNFESSDFSLDLPPSDNKLTIKLK